MSTVAERAATAYTAEQLEEQLRELGIPEGKPLFVQAALSSVGPVCGGAAGLVDALRAVLGEAGTLMVYTGTPENSDTSRLHLTAIEGMTDRQIADFRARMPAFDPAATPCSPTMGRLSEYVRTLPGAFRSSHPQTSFAALGRQAEWLTRSHPLDCHLGRRSPLGRLYEADGSVLLIGVTDRVFTAYHLADSEAPEARTKRYGCVLPRPDGTPHWVHWDAPDLDDLHFPDMGKAVRSEVAFAEGPVGAAHCFLVPVAPAVDAAARWHAERSLHGHMR